MKQDYQFEDTWPTNTEIDWWNAGREKLNRVINAYNQWQVDQFDPRVGEWVLVQIELGRQTWAARDGGQEWLATLDRMTAFVEGRLPKER